MKLFPNKPTNLVIKTEELSPIRKPRFQRTQSYDMSTQKRHMKVHTSLSSNNLSDTLGIQVKFVPPVVLDGLSRQSPLKHNKQQSRLGLLIQSKIKAYKREVTPFRNQTVKKQVSSQNYLQRLLAKVRELQKTVTEKQIQIAELQDQNQRIKQKLQGFDELEMEKRDIVKRLSMLQNELHNKKKQLTLLQDTLKQNEDFLSQTRDSLERLRKQMQENKIEQLRAEKVLLLEKIKLLENRLEFQHQEVIKMDEINIQLSKDMEILASDNEKLSKQIYSRSATVGILKEQSLTKEIEILKEQITESQSEHQKYLEGLITNQKKQITELKDANKVLYIKLDVIMKKLEQKEKDKKKGKDKEFIQLQTKFRKFLLEYKNFRKEHNLMLERNMHLVKNQNRTKGSNICICGDDSFSLAYSLTPERSLA